MPYFSAPHFSAARLICCLLAILAITSPLSALSQEVDRNREVTWVPVIDATNGSNIHSPRREPESLIVAAQAIPLGSVEHSPIAADTTPKPKAKLPLKKSRSRPTVHLASSFDPTTSVSIAPQPTRRIERRCVQERTLQIQVATRHQQSIAEPKLEQTDTTVTVAPTHSSVAASAPVLRYIMAEPILAVAVIEQSPESSNLPVPRDEAVTTKQKLAEAEEIEASELGLKPISTMSTRIAPQAGELPKNYAAARFAREGQQSHHMGYSRATIATEISWEAPAVCHQPLYFEDINLERYGYKIPLIQPAISAAHFFGRVPLLPYMIVSEGHRKCQYTLGHYRPGDYAPYSLYAPRLRFDATAAEMAIAAGLIFAIP
jgi:hypothetical protein